MTIPTRLPDLSHWKAQVKCQTGCPVATDAGRYVQLIADGDKLLASRELAATGSAAAAERADQDNEVGCLKGQVQRFFRAQGDLTGPPYKQSPGSAVGLMASWLRLRGYNKIVDDLDLRDENLGAAVLQNPQTGITFFVTVRNGQKPNIMIVGKTSCYERDS